MFKLIKRKENRKEIFKYSSFALFVSMLWGCSDWTKPEAEDFFEMPGNDYYENLRAYKTFGAFGCIRLVWRLDGCRGFDGGQSDGASR